MFETVSRIVGCMIPIALLGAYASDWRPNMDFSTESATRVSSECSWVYRVGEGDTVKSVAGWAIGAGGYQILVDANPDLLKSGASLKPGDKLLLPCRERVAKLLEAAANDSAADAPASNATPNVPVTNAVLRTTTSGATEGPTEGPTGLELRASADLGNKTATNVVKVASLDTGTRSDLVARPAINAVLQVPVPALADGAIHFLTSSDFGSFVNSGLPDGAMVTDLVRSAMSTSGLKNKFSIYNVDDRSVHLDMLERQFFDLGFPWYRPDCTMAKAHGPTMQWLCEEFEFSDPLIEVTIGYYVRPHDPLLSATGYDQLVGRRICRPANHFTFDLLQQGLMDADTTLVTPPLVYDCLTKLLNGEVDVATFSKSLEQAEMSRLSALGYFVEITALASDQSLHVVAPKGKPQAVAYLDQINQGIAGLQAAGRLNEMSARHSALDGTEVR